MINYLEDNLFPLGERPSLVLDLRFLGLSNLCFDFLLSHERSLANYLLRVRVFYLHEIVSTWPKDVEDSVALLWIVELGLVLLAESAGANSTQDVWPRPRL